MEDRKHPLTVRSPCFPSTTSSPQRHRMLQRSSSPSPRPGLAEAPLSTANVVSMVLIPPRLCHGKKLTTSGFRISLPSTQKACHMAPKQSLNAAGCCFCTKHNARMGFTVNCGKGSGEPSRIGILNCSAHLCRSRLIHLALFLISIGALLPQACITPPRKMGMYVTSTFLNV